MVLSHVMYWRRRVGVLRRMLWGKGRHAAVQARSVVISTRAASAALAVVCAAYLSPCEAKSPGSKYCFSGWCHRVGTLSQTESLVGWRGYLVASYYDDCRRDRLNPCGLTSSGAVFRPDLPDNAASPLFPDGTVIIAFNPKTGDASVLRITNAGPYSRERKLDVSRAGAEKLGFRSQGVASLVVSVLKSPTREEATYVRRRVYPSVPGYLGRFENFDAAFAVAASKVEIDQEPETASVSGGDELVAAPRRAVSPYFARELMMLRVPPRPVKRARSVEDILEREGGPSSKKKVAGKRPAARRDDVAGNSRKRSTTPQVATSGQE